MGEHPHYMSVFVPTFVLAWVLLSFALSLLSLPKILTSLSLDLATTLASRQGYKTFFPQVSWSVVRERLV